MEGVLYFWVCLCFSHQLPVYKVPDELFPESTDLDSLQNQKSVTSAFGFFCPVINFGDWLALLQGSAPWTPVCISQLNSLQKDRTLAFPPPNINSEVLTHYDWGGA